MESPTIFNWTSLFLFEGMLGGNFHLYSNFDKIILFANSEDPDQTPCSAASDLGQHCLPSSCKKEARQIWVKRECEFISSNTIAESRLYKKWTQ